MNILFLILGNADEYQCHHVDFPTHRSSSGRIGGIDLVHFGVVVTLNLMIGLFNATLRGASLF